MLKDRGCLLGDTETQRRWVARGRVRMYHRLGRAKQRFVRYNLQSCKANNGGCFVSRITREGCLGPLRRKAHGLGVELYSYILNTVCVYLVV